MSGDGGSTGGPERVPGSDPGRKAAAEPDPEPRDGEVDYDAPRERRRRPRPIQGGPGVKPERRVPAWVVVPLAFGAGFFMSGWAGGVFGLAVGLALWWMRR